MKKLTSTLLALLLAEMVFAAGGGSYTVTCQIIIGLETYEWLYTLSTDGKATVVAAPRTINGRLEVPELFDGHPVVGIASSAFANRGDIEELVLPDGLTYIDYYAFQNCTNLTELTIPDTVQSMGSGVFGGCTSLEKLTIPFVGTMRGKDSSNASDSHMKSQFGYMFGSEGLHDDTRAVNSYLYYTTGGYYSGIARSVYYTYYVPTNLIEVVVTDETMVTQYAFYGCEDLKRITFQGSVTNVQEGAFKNCTSLEIVTFPDGLGAIGDSAFANCRNLKSDTLASLPSSVKSIGSYAFSGCDLGLTEITMPDSVRSIGSQAFQNCSNVVAATLSSSLTSVGAEAFQNCMGITKLTVPSTVQWIGQGAFGGCTSLEKLTIPFVGTRRGQDISGANDASQRSQFGYMFDFVRGYDGAWRDGYRPVRSYIQHSGIYAGGRWTYEYTYYIPATLKEVVVTDDTLVTSHAFYGCSGLTNITFTSSVTNMQEGAFKNCTSLEMATFPDGLKAIGDSAFMNCRNLKSDTLASLPSSVKSIGSSAFSGCDLGLTEITMPDSVRSIGSRAFQNCSNVVSAALSSSLASIGYEVFQNCAGLTELTIPDTVQTMGSGVFGGCKSLEKLTIPFVGTKRGEDTSTSDDRLLRSQFGYMFGGDGIHDGARAVGSYLQHGGIYANGSWSYRYTYYIPTNLSEVVVTDDTLITQYAFYGCKDLNRITFIGNVTNMQEAAFKDCTSLEKATIFGNKPRFGINVFSGVPESCVIRVSKLSSGWGVEIPGAWNGRRIEYITDETLPEVADEADVGVNTALFADARVAENVTTVEQYDAFREWAYGAKLPNGALGGSKAAMESPHAWQSFALGADRLIDKDITSDDIHIVSFGADDGSEDAAVSEFTLEVAIDGVEIGKGLVEEDVLNENLKNVLGVEGATELKESSFSTENLDVTLECSSDGKAKATVTPNGTPPTFFVRVKVK